MKDAARDPTTEGRHVAHVLPWDTVGGTEHATVRVARAAAGYGFRSTAFCPSASGPVAEIFRAAGFEVAPYEPVELGLRRPHNFALASVRLAREFRRRGVGLVHCADVLGAHYAALAGRLAGVPVVCQVRSRYAVLPRRERNLLRFVSRFVFVSRDTWRHFTFPVAPHKGAVVYDGIDASDAAAHSPAEARAVREEFRIPEGVKVVGMVARLARQKDYPTLARAAARVVAEYPEVRFMVVGDNSLSADHRAHYAEVAGVLESLGVARHFVFTGFREDVSRLMSAFDVFVLSTHAEGLPLVILEAMAGARPVVATAVDGVPEVVKDGETGLVHAHEDDEGLAAALLSVLRDEALAARLGDAGRAFVRANFTRESFAAGIAAVYESVLGRGVTPAPAGAAGAEAAQGAASAGGSLQKS